MSKRIFCDFCGLEINDKNPVAGMASIPILPRDGVNALPVSLSVFYQGTADICQTCLDDSFARAVKARSTPERSLDVAVEALEIKGTAAL